MIAMYRKGARLVITLYWSPNSRAERMFWVLEEIGQPYALEPIDIRAEVREDPAAFLAASPLGKVPAIIDGDARVSDSAAIALYLADRYSAGDLAPRTGDPARGEFLYWLFYTPSVMEPAMMEKFVELPPNPLSYPWGSFDSMLSALEHRLKTRDWLAAGRFTVADLMVSGTVQFMQMFKMLEPSDTLRAHMERCLSRPAAIRGQEKCAAAKTAQA